MFKKLLIASAVLAVSSSVALAGNYKGEYKGEPAPAPCPTYTYMTGPYVGFSVGPRVNIAGAPAAYTGLEGTLSAGYGAMIYPAWYLAGEVLIQDSASLKDFKTTSGDSVRSNWGYGIDVLPGYMITDHVLSYLRLGVVRTRFAYSSNFSNQNLTGWQIGLGGQTQIAPNWDVRGEYVYTQYNSTRNGVGKPLAHQANLGLVYKFV